MAFADRIPRDCVGESERAAVRGKLEVSRNLETVITQGPVLMQGLSEFLNLVGAQRLDATFAGLAVFVDERVVHVCRIYREIARWGGLLQACPAGGLLQAGSYKKAGPEGPAVRRLEKSREGKIGVTSDSPFSLLLKRMVR